MASPEPTAIDGTAPAERPLTEGGRAARDMLSMSLTQVVVLVAGVLAGILAARLLGPSGRGGLALLQANAALLQTFLCLDTSALLYFGASGLMPLRQLLRIYLAVAAAAAVPVSILLAANGGSPLLFPSGLREPVHRAFVLVTFVVSVVSEVFVVAFQARGRFGAVNRISLETSAFVLLGVTTLSVGRLAGVSNVGLESVLGVYALAGALRAARLAITLRAAGHGDAPGALSVTGSLAELLRFSWPAQLSSWANFLNYRLDVWLVALFCGRDELGLYSVAVGVSQLLWLGPQASQAVVFRLTAARRDPTDRLVARVSRVSVFVTTAAALGLIAVAGRLVPYVYGARFSGSVPALRVLLLAATLASVSKVWAGYIAGHGGVRQNLLAVLAGLVVTVSLDLLLIPKMGILGAAIASTAAYGAITAWCGAVLAIRHDRPLADMLVPQRDDFVVLMRFAKGLRG